MEFLEITRKLQLAEAEEKPPTYGAGYVLMLFPVLYENQLKSKL